MLDIGWSEMAVIALLALVIIGPKDLPKVMRTVGQWVRKARAVSREFQSSVDEMIRDADLEDAKKAIQSTKNLNVDRMLDETIDPTGDLKKEVRAVETAARDDASGTADKPAVEDGTKAEGEKPAAAAGATVIKHPVQPAPPHSLAPPKEPTAETAAAAAAEPAESDASGQKSA